MFGAVLGADYSLSTTDLGYGASDSVVVVEANTTSTFKVLGAGDSLTVNACGKWDFQLYSVAPLLPNGELAGVWTGFGWLGGWCGA